MKRLSLVVTALLVSVTMSFASDVKKESPKEELVVVNVGQLSRFLQLTSSQMDEIEQINEWFVEAQQRTLYDANEQSRNQKMNQALLGNLKLMKGVLTPEQYRLYVSLLNLTYNNIRQERNMAVEQDAYLANQN